MDEVDAEIGTLGGGRLRTTSAATPALRLRLGLGLGFGFGLGTRLRTALSARTTGGRRSRT
eukprot:13081493-Alexandrium_andersonii.AAC.1